METYKYMYNISDTFGSGSGASFYIPFLVLSGDGVFTLPSVDDGSFPITLPEPLPLGAVGNVATYTIAYVS